MSIRRIDDPDRPFSAARVAIWALGIVTLVAVIGMIWVAVEGREEVVGLRTVAQTAIGALATAAALRVGGGK